MFQAVLHDNKKLLQRGIVWVQCAAQVQCRFNQAFDAQLGHVHQVKPLDGNGVLGIWKSNKIQVWKKTLQLNMTQFSYCDFSYTQCLTGFSMRLKQYMRVWTGDFVRGRLRTFSFSSTPCKDLWNSGWCNAKCIKHRQISLHHLNHATQEKFSDKSVV